MHQSVLNKVTATFPAISFRKKRLTVAIHAHFNMESADDVAAVRQMIEDVIRQLAQEGDAKVSYSVTDV